MNLRANLDCEATWAGVALPAAVRARVSLYATLIAACAPDDGVHDVWLPAAIDPARLVAHPGWTPPRVHTGAPPGSFDLVWADPAAKDANDRSRTLAIAEALGVALPGARVVASLAALDAHLTQLPGAWVCKARWTAAGRDRAHGTGPVGDGELRRRLARMFDRLGPLVVEPWLDRVADFGVCGTIDDDDRIRIEPPHRLRTDPRGGFIGIDLAPPDDADLVETLTATARAAAIRLTHTTGYRGPFAIDAFTYRASDTRVRLHPLCEINARRSFGWIARGLAGRLAIRTLGFDAPPPGAHVLITPGDDRVSAWCA